MSDLSQKFERDGFVVIENVFNDEEIEEMKGAIGKIVDDMNLAEHPKSVFSTYDEDKFVFNIINKKKLWRAEKRVGS
ncbi:hypothetical protein GCK72_012188 [Caenorhabditis remanei]|uniref:Phytanoyl-CoA dioxygenase n=1 Tax=Caenorhabditis remanei TaxID=31234 RepID=A0A6A5GKB7_CAERE|nr:hypothetical protein GCK72_012188 [Caenorhabditis remanei]KAF1755738.1 hypothetical protein GCK72_012188 [Caenorhabditis remanei]